MRTRPRLQVRIARYISVVVVVSLLAGALALQLSKRRSLVRSMEGSARTYSALVSLAVVRAADLYRTSGRHILRQNIRRWSHLNQDLVRLEVVDVNGNVVMVSDGEEVETWPPDGGGPRIEDPELLAAVQGLSLVAGRVRGEDNERSFRVVAPAVEEWGRHTFSLVATFGYGRVDREVIRTTLLTLLAVVVGLVLARRVSFVLARNIGQNVARLYTGVQRFEAGHLDERVEVQSGDEIQDLAEAFNAMAEKLSRTIDELRQANRELESLDQAKADLVANVSHELRTPLTALQGYLELLVTGELGEVPEEARRALEVCDKNLKRLSLRIAELVQLSQIEKTPMPLLVENVHLGQLLHEVMETLLPTVQERNLFCSLNLATDLPPVVGNPEQLERVFLNLLNNALKFTPAGGFIRVSAEPYVHRRRQGVLTRVSDTGVGIPGTEKLRIFDRFYQVDPSSRRKYGGMGLGLSLVRSTVEAHRGAVWVESEVGQGSTFFVWLPRDFGTDSSPGISIRRLASPARLEDEDNV
jgi:signal transduction histidine kinase